MPLKKAILRVILIPKPRVQLDRWLLFNIVCKDSPLAALIYEILYIFKSHLIFFPCDYNEAKIPTLPQIVEHRNFYAKYATFFRSK